MTVQAVLDVLQQKAPFETAEEWDNAGLLIGDAAKEIGAVVVALDVTNEVIDRAVAEGAELIVTHHPVIFEPLKRLPANSVAYRLAQAGIAVISAHTNADKAVGGVNDCLCELLGCTAWETAPDGMSRIGTLPVTMTADAFAAYVAGCLHTAVRASVGDDLVNTVAVCGGGGADRVLSLLAKADAAVTGEVKHHEWLSVPPAKTLVDGGHYATEAAVTDRFAGWLSEAFPAVRIVLHRGEAPYQTIEG